MSLAPVVSPFQPINGLTGIGLNAGRLYIGVDGADPQITPQACYWDTDGTIPATQPVDILGGYTMYLGSPARLYTGATYSIRVRDHSGSQVFYEAHAVPGANVGNATFNTISDARAAVIPNTYHTTGLTLLGYFAAGDGGGASYRYATVQSTGPGKLQSLDGAWWEIASVVAAVECFGAKGDGSTDDAAAILNAVAWAVSVGGVVTLSPKTYAYGGATTLSVDLGHISLQGRGSTLDCTACTASYALNIYSSQVYPGSAVNGTRRVSGIVWKGARIAGRHGLKIGHPTYAYCDQMEVADGAILGFDRNIEAIDNAWRFKLSRMVSATPLNYSFYAAAGLVNAGEEWTFDHCEFRDGGAGGLASKEIYCAHSAYLSLLTTSVLNQTINLSGTCLLRMFGGNVENPGNATFYPYAKLASQARLSLCGTTLVMNPDATFTNAPFQLTGTTAAVAFDNVVFPDGNHLQFEIGAGYRAFVSGSGGVLGNACDYRPLSGGEHPCVSKAGNGLYNGDLETGDVSGWTVAAYGAGGSTGTATAAAKKNGNFGLDLLTVAGGGINASQKCACRPGQLVSVGAWGKLQTSGGAPCGYIQLTFLDADGLLIQGQGEEIVSAAWAWVGTSLTRRAPAGAATAQLILNAQASAAPNEIYFDEAILNVC